jgi:tyrosine-protein phosphatase SIW14
MARSLRVTLGIVIVLVLIAAPVGFALHQQADMRNFRVVREGVLYRSGQMTVRGLERAVHDYGIRTVVTLRDTYSPNEATPDADEVAFCQRRGITHIRIPPRTWDSPDGSPPAEEGVRCFRAIMADPRNHPVLVHCFAGIHRTGAYTAIYRMEFERWPNARAIAEMKACGYVTLDDELDILDYLEQYRPTWQPPPAPPPPASPKPRAKPKAKHAKKKHAGKKTARG